MISECPRVRVQGWDGAASCLGPHEVLARLLLIRRSRCRNVCPCSQGCWQYCFLRWQNSWSLASSESTKGGKVSLPADGTTVRRAVLVTTAVSCGLEPSHRSCSVSRGGDYTKASAAGPGATVGLSATIHPVAFIIQTHSAAPRAPKILISHRQTQSSSAPHWNLQKGRGGSWV